MARPESKMVMCQLPIEAKHSATIVSPTVKIDSTVGNRPVTGELRDDMIRLQNHPFIKGDDVSRSGGNNLE